MKILGDRCTSEVNCYFNGIAEQGSRSYYYRIFAEFGKVILIHFNLDADPNSPYKYQGTGCVQFAYPEDAERAIKRINEDRVVVGGRVLRMTRADREFNIVKIGHVPLHARHARFPRISLSGDPEVLDSSDNNWHLPPSEWVGIA